MVVCTRPRENSLLRAASLHRASRSSTSLPCGNDQPAPSFTSFLQSVAPVPGDSLSVPLCSKRRTSSVYSSRSTSAANAGDQVPSPRALRESIVPASATESTSSTARTAIRDSLPSPASYASSDYSPPSSVFEPYEQKANVFSTVTAINLTFLDDDDSSTAESHDALYKSIRLWRASSLSSQSSQPPEAPAAKAADSWFDDDKPAVDGHVLEWCPSAPSQVRRRSSAPQLMRATQEKTLPLEPLVEPVVIKTVSADTSPTRDFQGPADLSSATARPSTANDASPSKPKSKARPRGLWLPNAPSLFKSRSLRSKQSPPSKADISGPVHLQASAPSPRPAGITAMLGRSKTAPADDSSPGGMTTEERRDKVQAKRARLREDLKASIKLIGETSPHSIWASKQKCHDV